MIRQTKTLVSESRDNVHVAATSTVSNVQRQRCGTATATALAMGMTLGESFPRRNDNVVADSRPSFHQQSSLRWLRDTPTPCLRTLQWQRFYGVTLPDAASPKQAVDSKLPFHSSLTEPHASSSTKLQNSARHRTDNTADASSYDHVDLDRGMPKAAWSAPTTALSTARALYALTNSTPSSPSSRNMLDRTVLRLALAHCLTRATFHRHGCRRRWRNQQNSEDEDDIVRHVGAMSLALQTVTLISASKERSGRVVVISKLVGHKDFSLNTNEPTSETFTAN
jgi:hypothetical protein